MKDFFRNFGLVREFSTVDDRSSIVGLSTPFFKVAKNHFGELALSHWSWEKDFVLFHL